MRYPRYPGREATYLHRHRGIRRPASKGMLLWSLLNGLALAALWVLLLPEVGGAWVWILDVVREPLGMAESTTAIHYLMGDRLVLVLPRLDVPAGLPSLGLLWANAVACIAMVVVSFLLPVKMAPTNYFLRAAAMIHGSAVVFFLLKPWPYPYTAGDYLTGLTGAGMVVIGFVPVVLAATHWLLDFPWPKKLGLAIAIMGYLALMIPVKYAVHAVVLYWGGLLYMPALFILFGLPVEVFAFIALFSWGMSWELRAPRLPLRSLKPAGVLMLLASIPFADAAASERADTDLSLTAVVDVSTPPAGTDVVITITVAEESGDPATNVIIDAELATGLVHQSWTASSGTYNPGTGDWTLASVPGSGSATLTITATVNTFLTVTQWFEVKAHDELDVDSTPGNESTTEDDDASVQIAPVETGGQVCYLVADSGDNLTKILRSGAEETLIGATGTVYMEASAYWPGSDILYAASQGDFGILDTASGVFTEIGHVGTAGGSLGEIALTDVDGLAFHPHTGALWATHRREGVPEDLIFRIDPATGAHMPDAFGVGIDYLVVESLDPTGYGDIDDLSIDAIDGTIYAIANDDGVGDRLVIIDPSDGSVTDIGELGAEDMEGFSFDGYGVLYGVTGTNDAIYTIEKSTGSATKIADLGAGGWDYESVSCLIDGVNVISGSVFYDANANGEWDPGTDSDASGITVELYRDVNSDGLVDAGDRLVAEQDSDGSGDFSFTVASQGAFVMQIDTGDLPTDGSMSTDNVEVATFVGFGQSDVGNLFGYRRPIDLSVTVTVDEPSPDVDSDVVFTVTVSNAGPVDATSVTVTNTLPDSLAYVSALPSQGTFDSGTGIWTVGTLPVGDTQSMDVTATVHSKGPATDWAQVTTADQPDVDSTPDNSIPSEDDQDDATVTPTGGSGGGDGGMESNGSLAGKLARVLFTRRMELEETGTPSLPRFQYDPAAGKSASSDILRSVVPTSGPDDSAPFETSPRDLLPVTNAADVVAADFLRSRDDRRIGVVFATLTRLGALYEHTKVVCDRLRGAELVDVRTIEASGQPFLLSRLVHEDGAVDHAVSYVAYRSGDGFVVDSRFRLDEYQPPPQAEDVINVQIWSVSPEYTRTMLEQSLTRLATHGPLTFAMADAPPRRPGLFVRTGSYANGVLDLSFHNETGAASIMVTGGTLQRTEEGDRINFEQTVPLTPPDERGISRAVLMTGPLFDASFFVETPEGDRDLVYLADGAWSYSYDGLGADVNEFGVSPERGAAKAGVHRVERAVSLEGEVTTWAVLFRYLRANGRPRDMSAYQYVEFTASGRGQVRVLFEKASVRTSDHFGTVVKLEDQPRTYRLWFDELRRPDGTGRLDASDLLLVSFYVIGEQGRSRPFALNVSDLRFGGADGDPLAETPDDFELKQNYPNPFNPSTRIAYGMPRDGRVRLEVYDTLGRSVATLVDGHVAAGRHEAAFDASGLASGVYLYRLTTAGTTQTRRMILLR